MKQKLEMTQVGDMQVAMKKWKEIFNRNVEMRKCKDIDTLGAMSSLLHT